MTNLGQAATRGAGVTLGAQAVRFALQLVSLIVLARLLTPTDFGLVAMATAIIGVAELLRDFGLSSAAIQAKTLSDAERSNLFWVNVAIGSGCTVVALLASPLIGRLYGAPQVTVIVIALAGLFVVSGANTQFRAELSRSLRFGALARSDICAQFLGITGAVVAAVLGAGFWSIVIQQGLFVTTTCLMNVVQSTWRPTRWQRGVSLRRFYSFGLSLLGMQVLGYTTNNIDTVAIGRVWGADVVGQYGRAYQLLIVPLNQVSQALTRVMLPVMSRLQDDDERFLRFARRAQLLCCYGFGGFFAVAAGLSGPLVAILFGARWAAVAPIFAVLAIGGIFRGMAQLSYWTVLAKGLTQQQLKFSLFARPVMIALLLAGLPWGAVGVAAGHSVGFAVEWAAVLWWIGRTARLEVRPFFTKALRIVLTVCLPAGLLAWAGTLLVPGAVWQLLVGVALVGCWVAVLAVLPTAERRDLRAIAEAVATLRRKPAGPGKS